MVDSDDKLEKYSIVTSAHEIHTRQTHIVETLSSFFFFGNLQNDDNNDDDIDMDRY